VDTKQRLATVEWSNRFTLEFVTVGLFIALAVGSYVLALALLSSVM